MKYSNMRGLMLKFKWHKNIHATERTSTISVRIIVFFFGLLVTVLVLGKKDIKKGKAI